MFPYTGKIINYPNGSDNGDRHTVAVRTRGKKRFNCGEGNVLIMGRDFLFVKYYGVDFEC